VPGKWINPVRAFAIVDILAIALLCAHAYMTDHAKALTGFLRSIRKYREEIVKTFNIIAFFILASRLVFGEIVINEFLASNQNSYQDPQEAGK